ncbi:MAG TPA: ATP-grasp domain-containing protein [Polyangia bacterium]|nr:ATP-grasp domain-containing protein [Polyangia bacterium]
MGDPFRALCAGSEQWLSFAHVPRLLKRAGAHVTFLGPVGAWPLRGGFVDTWLRADGDATRVAAALGRHLKQAGPYDWIVLGDDPLLAAVGARRDEAWARAALPLPADDVRVGLLGSKAGFVRAAQSLGLPLPPSRVCEGLEAIRAARDALGGSALIKEEGPSGGEGCHPIDSRTDLARLPSRLLSHPVVVQRLLPGPTIAVEAIYCQGRLRHAVTSTISRTKDSPFSVSAIRRFVCVPDAVDLASRLGPSIGLHGFANITLLRDPTDGRPLLVELDPRPNSLFHLAEALGVDLPATLRDVLAGRCEGPLRQLSPGTDVEVPVYPTDVIRCAQQWAWAGLAAWALNLDDRWCWLPRDDPRLLRACHRYLVRQLARGVLRATRRPG